MKKRRWLQKIRRHGESTGIVGSRNGNCDGDADGSDLAIFAVDFGMTDWPPCLYNLEILQPIEIMDLFIGNLVPACAARGMMDMKLSPPLMMGSKEM